MIPKAGYSTLDYHVKIVSRVLNLRLLEASGNLNGRDYSIILSIKFMIKKIETT